MAMMTRKGLSRPTPSSAAKTCLSIIGCGNKILTLKKNQILFSQGDVSDAVFYILEGKVKLTVVSQNGKEAVIAALERGAFLGEAGLTGQLVRMKTATSMGVARIVRIETADMLRILHEEPAFLKLFIAHLLSRNIHIEEDLVDQLFNSTEKRLARVLLLLARFGKESDKTELLTLKISQETLADIIGITQSKVSFFMKKFKKLGFIDNIGGLHVHSTLLNILLHD